MPVSKKRKKVVEKRKRPTPPKHVDPVREKGESPTWYVALMFGLMGIGGLLIILNYMSVLPGSVSNWYLVAGLAGIAGGFGMTMNYR